MVFQRSLSDSKSPQFLKTNLNNALVWMVSILPPMSNSSISIYMPLEAIPSAAITIGITFVFYSFLSFLARSKYLSLFVFFDFYSVVCWDDKIHYMANC